MEHARKLGIGVLTLFAFSSDNWRRPREEVEALMTLLADYLRKETPRCVDQGVRLEAIGRRDRLGPELCAAIALAEAATSGGTQLRLRMAVDYSGRDAILAAARSLLDLSRESLDGVLGPPVDLLIRTGGDRRISNYLLWQSAYTELYFTETLWPDFRKAQLLAAIEDYAQRQRRFGRIDEE